VIAVFFLKNRLKSTNHVNSETGTTFYVHDFIAAPPPRSTCSSSLLTLLFTYTSSSLRITDRSFRYASPFI